MTELIDCYLPVLKKTLKIINTSSNLADYTASRMEIITKLEKSLDDAMKLDIEKHEKDAAKLAVIAWIDERILCSTISWCHIWQNEPLQRKYLGTNIAGKQFFTELKNLSTISFQARKVFLFCLQNEFHGQYNSPENENRLADLITIQRQICFPNQWRSWPNEALITPEAIGLPANNLPGRHWLTILTVSTTLLYAVVYFILYKVIIS